MPDEYVSRHGKYDCKFHSLDVEVQLDYVDVHVPPLVILKLILKE
jgi:hypothetical protein